MKTLNLIPENLGKINFTDINKGEEHKITLSTINNVITAFQQQSQGFNSSQIRVAIKIEDKILACKEATIDFEDEEYIFIKNCFASVRWGGINRVFASAEHCVDNPIEKTKEEPQVDPKEVAKETKPAA